MRKPFSGRSLLVLLGALFVGGCAVPVPVQIASWALDGISYLTTQKSMTDHGLSFITHKDCALWRGVQGNNICDSIDDAGTDAVAALDAPNDPMEPSGGAVSSDQSIDFAVLETASGPVEDLGPAAVVAPFASGPSAVPLELAAVVVEPLRMAPPVAPAPVIASAAATTPAAQRILISGRRTWSDNPDADLYFVVGSFRKRDNAKRLVKRLGVIDPSVMASRVNGVETYRVAVGPFSRAERKAVDREIRAAGMKDAWAIRINQSEWMIAGPMEFRKLPVPDHKQSSTQTASLPNGLNIGG